MGRLILIILRHQKLLDPLIIMSQIHLIKPRKQGFIYTGKFTLLEPLKLVTGVRVSNWEYESEDGNGNRKYNNKVTPYAGLIYDFLEDYSWYASYTEIFKPENKQDANQQYLDPREGKSYETGLKGEFFDKQLNASMSGIFNPAR